MVSLFLLVKRNLAKCDVIRAQVSVVIIGCKHDLILFNCTNTQMLYLKSRFFLVTDNRLCMEYVNFQQTSLVQDNWSQLQVLTVIDKDGKHSTKKSIASNHILTLSALNPSFNELSTVRDGEFYSYQSPRVTFNNTIASVTAPHLTHHNWSMVQCCSIRQDTYLALLGRWMNSYVEEISYVFSSSIGYWPRCY